MPSADFPASPLSLLTPRASSLRRNAATPEISFPCSQAARVSAEGTVANNLATSEGWSLTMMRGASDSSSLLRVLESWLAVEAVSSSSSSSASSSSACSVSSSEEALDSPAVKDESSPRRRSSIPWIRLTERRDAGKTKKVSQHSKLYGALLAADSLLRRRRGLALLDLTPLHLLQPVHLLYPLNLLLN